jgi:hypothetical protein
MQDATHALAQRPVNHLMLLTLGLAGEAGRNSRYGPM